MKAAMAWRGFGTCWAAAPEVPPAEAEAPAPSLLTRHTVRTALLPNPALLLQTCCCCCFEVHPPAAATLLELKRPEAVTARGAAKQTAGDMQQLTACTECEQD